MRVFVAVLSGYAINGILVIATEQLLPSRSQKPSYFAVDFITQCLYTVCAGYLCCLIARPSRRIALAGLIALGLLVGTLSLISSWKSDPHWYGIGLLAVYAPCAWLGWTLRARQVPPHT